MLSGSSISDARVRVAPTQSQSGGRHGARGDCQCAQRLAGKCIVAP